MRKAMYPSNTQSYIGSIRVLNLHLHFNPLKRNEHPLEGK